MSKLASHRSNSIQLYRDDYSVSPSKLSVLSKRRLSVAGQETLTNRSKVHRQSPKVKARNFEIDTATALDILNKIHLGRTSAKNDSGLGNLANNGMT